MTKPAFMCLFMFLAAMVVVAGCDDDRGIQEAAPRVGSFHVGDSENPPAQDQLRPTPDSGEISIDFLQVDLGSLHNRYLFLRNTGRSSLKLSAFTWVPDTSPEFAVACLESGAFKADCGYSSADPLEIPAGDDLIIRVSYEPGDLGEDTGGFTLTLNAADHTTVTVNLHGEGVTPEIQVCITDCTGDQAGAECVAAGDVCNDQGDLVMNFGDVELGQQLRRQVVLSNLGDRPLQVDRLTFTGGQFNQFSLDTNGNALPGTLAAGAQAILFVGYAPGLGGEHDTVLEIGSNDVNEGEIRIPIHARGMAPRLCPDPLVVDFGNVATGEADVQSFTVTNCGLLDLHLLNVALAVDSSPDFDLLNLPALPLVLAPDESTSIEVEYHPAEMGSDDGGVELFSDDPASDPATDLTGTITLLGTSVPRACEIQATPFRVDFGGVVQDDTQEMDLIISNLGTDTCTLDRVEITQNSVDSEFALIETPGENIDFEPGETLLVKLTYHPVDLGIDTGRLTIYGNDKDGDVAVDLNGEGVETASCDLQIDPGLINFGMVKYGNTKPMIIQLTNQGLEVCNVTAIELELVPFFGEDFSITAQPNLPLVVNRRGQPGSQAEIEATFAPQPGGIPFIQVATITIHVNGDPDLGDRACTDANGIPIPGQACITLMGYGKESEIEVVPDELDFGVVTVGCNSPELCVTVYNLGTTDVSLDDIYLEDPADPNFEITSAPMTPSTLTGGGSFEVCVRYHPQDLNVHRSVLYIEVDGDETLTVPLFGRGTDVSDQTDVFYQPDQVRSDVLFVVDCSGSMGDNQENLANNFDSFINWAITLDVDYHIGVVATEVEDMPGYTGTPPRPVHPGELIEVTGRPKIITNQTPDVTEAFKDLVRLGDGCSNHEAGLEAAWMALSQPLVDDPAINGGFLREDAKLYIIILSDEPDQSKGNVDFYVDFFSSIKGYRNTDMMAVSAICSEYPDGRYCTVATLTEGICESIDTADWASVLASLGFDAFAAIREFPLSRPADPNTITVRVNGAVISRAGTSGGADGWTYYADTNTVFFGDDVVPGKGDQIEVSYTAQCL